MSPRILFLVPDDLDALERKGVAHMIAERDEHGFFERVVTVHPIASRRRTLDLDATHRIVEFDVGRALRQGRWTAAALVPFRLLALICALVILLRRERIDVIRATDPYLMGLLAWAASLATGTPFCVSIHADYEKNFELTPKRGLAAWLRRLAAWCPGFVLPRAHLVLPIRQTLARWAEHHGASPERTCVIPHGLRLHRFTEPVPHESTLARLGIAPGEAVVSFVGRLSRYNYVYDVLAVAERILPTRPGVVFVLVGDGEERPAIERRLASQPALSDRVRLAGFRPADDVVAVRSVSAVSLVLMGGFSLIEACAAGSAVIAYDVDWHREIITDGETGRLVAEGDIAGLTAAVEQLLDDPPLARRLAENARAFVLAHYDERQTSTVKRRCYQLLLDQALG